MSKTILVEWPGLFFWLRDPLFSNSEHILQNAAILLYPRTGAGLEKENCTDW
jgi:hypothetical protein